MRLFIFEGEAEERVFKTLKHLFMSNEHEIVCVFHSNIYALYSRLKKHSVFESEIANELDIVSVLNELLLETGDYTLEPYVNEVFAEVFLFFDYDFHDKRGTLQENNNHLLEMMSYFSDETGNGKLYINYPMLEAYRYIKHIPDSDYVNYLLDIEKSMTFKRLTSEFSAYSVDHFALSESDWESKNKRDKRLVDVKKNWVGIIPMNVSKANFICTERNELPLKKDDVCQIRIFNNQLTKYVAQEPSRVAVLSAFPLFLYEYLKPEVLSVG